MDKSSSDRSHTSSTLRAFYMLEKRSAAYCMVKSRPMTNISYQQMTAAYDNGNKLDLGTPLTIVILPHNTEADKSESHALVTEPRNASATSSAARGRKVDRCMWQRRRLTRLMIIIVACGVYQQTA